MKRTEIEDRTEALVQPILDRNSFRLWSVEYVKEGGDMYLRVYIDKDGGININDCVLVSHELEKLLDDAGIPDEPYTLEVSSPGLTRKLRTDRDFKNSIGRLVAVKLYKKVDDIKETVGYLDSYDAGEIVITDEDGIQRSFARDNIAAIHLEYVEELQYI